MPLFVPDKLTPLTTDQAISAFADGWSLALSFDPKARPLAALTAHTILECGAGYKSLHWFNFGNEKASPSYRGKYTMYRCNEVINGHLQWFDPPHPQTWFRAFDTAAEGAAEHVRFLATDSDGDGKNIYAPAWQAVLAGNPEAFVRAMKTAGYFTGNVEAYVKATVSICNQIEPACARILAEEHHGITHEDELHVAQLFSQWADHEVHPEDYPLPPEDKIS